MSLSLYELLDQGVDPKQFLDALSPGARKGLLSSWSWRARPGQRWVAGPELVTDHQAGRGWGKALALDTPLPTPEGWTTMGCVQVGDQLLDEQGKTCTVTGTFEVDAREAWRLWFSDGAHIDACGDHLWVTLDALERKRLNRKGRPIPADWASKPPLQTRDVVKTLFRGKRGDRNHSIPVAQPLDLPKKELPLDPYLLGVWLGDGSRNNSDITCHEDDAPHYEVACTKAGLTWTEGHRQKKSPKVGVWSISRSPPKATNRGPRSTNPFFLGLKSLGVLKNKHIPSVYLRASKEQRLALLQGLMDTDGYIAPESGHAEFTTVLPALVSGFMDLARGLGQKPISLEGRSMLNGVDHGPKWRINWRPTIPVVTLPRKLAQVRERGAQWMRNEHRMIVGAEPLPPQKMRCVTVDSPHSMYLAGAGMIPTHNTYVGSESLCDAAEDPERWGGFAVIGGPDPRQVKRDCLTGPSGLFSAADRRAKHGGLGIVYKNYNDRLCRFESPRGGGDAGLTIYWAASSDPKSFRGPNYGLAWLDEFGVWYHQMRDEQGTNAWQALLPALRAGPDPKVLITQTPSRAPEVRALQVDAERPECPVCQAAFLSTAPGGQWKGTPGQEPWRLPSSPRQKVHDLFGTRTTLPVRTCPTCQTEVTARVRLVTGSTLDNCHLARSMRAAAERALAANTPAARAEFDPQGELDQAPVGALVREEDVRKIEMNVADMHPDRWSQVVAELDLSEILVFVDPAVTSGPNADETGVVAVGLREIGDSKGNRWLQCVGLEDGTVRPDEVDGAPSSVWAPRALWMALRWGCKRIIVETNQGGQEVLASLKSALQRPPSEDELLKKIALEIRGHENLVQVRGYPSLVPTGRRMLDLFGQIKVESVHRRSGKPARFGWYGEGASRQEQALACVGWLEGPRHWQRMLAVATSYEPDQDKKRGTEKKDRFDALVGGAQVLLKVRETKGGVVSAGGGWMTQAPVGF